MNEHQAGVDGRRLAAAVARVAEEFEGAVSPDERGCAHCYGEEEVAALRTPGAPLSEELIGFVSREVPSHWTDGAAVARRILPGLTALLAAGRRAEEEAGRMLRAARWPEWPTGQAGAVREFLDAYWESALRSGNWAATYGAYEFCTAAESTAEGVRALRDQWVEGMDAETFAAEVEGWIDVLLRRDDEELRSWIMEQAAPRLRADESTDPELLYQLGQLALPPELRWE